MQKKSVYEIITNEVIKSLDNGVVPWRKPWAGDCIPCNYFTRRPYSGLNLFLLNAKSFTSKFFLTFLQVSELGGKVKKGANATPIIFWKMISKEEKRNDGTVEKNEIPILRYYSVFNAEQIEEIDFVDDEAVSENKEEFTPIQVAETLLASIKERFLRLTLVIIRRPFTIKIMTIFICQMPIFLKREMSFIQFYFTK